MSGLGAGCYPINPSPQSCATIPPNTPKTNSHPQKERRFNYARYGIRH